MDLYREADIISESRKERVGWLAHEKRMSEQKLCINSLRNSQKKKGPFERRGGNDRLMVNMI